MSKKDQELNSENVTPAQLAEMLAELKANQAAFAEQMAQFAKDKKELEESKKIVEAQQANFAKQYASEIDKTRDALKAMPKVMLTLPLGETEKPGAYEEVTINGYRTIIKKGEYVEVPKAVADIINEKYRITATVGKNLRADREEVKEGGVKVADALS